MVPADLIEKGNELKKTLRIVLIKVKIKKRTVSSIFYDYGFDAVNEKHLGAIFSLLITPVFKARSGFKDSKKARNGIDYQNEYFDIFCFGVWASIIFVSDIFDEVIHHGIEPPA